MDARQLQYQTRYFDLIIDKSTIDALLCGDSAFMNVAKMMNVCCDPTYLCVGMPKSTQRRWCIHVNIIWYS